MIIYLYVKQHKITKKLYFGKTIKKNPFSYRGSGTYWKKHLRKHGSKFVETINVWGFDDQELCTKFALNFSKNNDIVNSSDWANNVPENGLDGGKLHEGFVCIKDSNTTKLISKQEFGSNPNIFGVAKGTVIVKDRTGKCYRIDLNDERYISGELVNNRSKMCYVKNSENVLLWIKYKNYDKTVHEFVEMCPHNDYEGYRKTALGAKKRKGRSYNPSQRQLENLAKIWNSRRRPKEERQYVCSKCGKIKIKLEYTHHPIKENYKCCSTGRPRKIPINSTES